VTDDAPQAWMDVRTRLPILNVESAAEITQVLGVPPSKTWLAGDTVAPRARNVHHQSGWLLQSPLEGRVDPEASLDALLKLIPDPSSFNKLPKGCEIQATFTLYGETGRPSLLLSAKAIQQLAVIGASLDIDTYDLTDASEFEERR
jgi:hypothetical protein